MVPQAPQAAQHYITAIGENPQGSGGLASNRGPEAVGEPHIYQINTSSEASAIHL